MIVNKNGTLTSFMFGEYHIEPDGSIWEQCMFHNNPSVNLFSNTDSFATGVYKNKDMWLNFNVCKSLTSFEFLYVQKSKESDDEVKYRWIQSKSPFEASYSDVAPSAVTRITTEGYTDGGKGGLFYRNSNAYFIIANENSGNWFGATGSWTAHQGGIPGYPNTVCTTGNISIFVRVDNNHSLKNYNHNDCLIANDFIEI